MPRPFAPSHPTPTSFLHPAAFPSADYLLDELEATAADCRRLHSPRLAAAVRRAVTDTFQLYTAALAAALNRQLQLRGAAGDGVDGARER